MATDVDHSPDGYKGVEKFAWRHNLGFKLQSLQRKEDYVKVYPRSTIVNPIVVAPSVTCAVLKSGRHFWTVDGIELPCSFIKDTRGYDKQRFTAQWEAGFAPPECRLCSHIRPQKLTKA